MGVEHQTRLREVEVQALDAARLEPLIGADPHGALRGDRRDEPARVHARARRNADELRALIRPGDVALLHDPQPAGLAAAMRTAGARVVWRCHVGDDAPNEWTVRAWEFLRPYLEGCDAYVFSRAEFAPPWIDRSRCHVIAPSIDPFSAKNEPMSRRNVRLALGYTGLLQGDHGPPVVPFTRRTAPRGASTATSTSCRAAPSHRLTRRWCSRRPGGTS